METFRLGHVLSVTTGFLLCEGEDHPIYGVYRILNHLTGDDLFTHQLPAAAEQCAPHILEQYPSLRDVTGEGITRDNCMQVLGKLKQEYGDSFLLAPLPAEKRVHRSPFDDFADLAKVIPVIIHD